MKELVTIVIPVYNGEKYIDSCMKGILNQTYTNIQVILVNDGSSDKTGDICDKYSASDNRIKVIHGVNEGLSSARNKGIKASTGDYIVFCDIDDEVSDKWIEENLELAVKYDADVVMYCFWYYNVDKGILTDNCLPKLFVGNGEDYFREYLIPTIDTEVFNAPWNKMIKKNVLIEKNLSFDTSCKIYEDLMFASELLPSVDKIVVNNKMYYKYYVRSSGSLITKFSEQYFDSVTNFYSNVMRYCNRFQENFNQKIRFNELYTKLVMTHLKQISCNKELSVSKKYELLKRICDEPKLIHAMRNVKMKKYRKKYIQQLVLAGKYKKIYRLYNFLGKLQGI